MKYLLPIDGLREMMLKPLLVQILGDIGKMLGEGSDVFMVLKDEPLRLVRSPNGNIEDNRLYSLKSTANIPNNYLKLDGVQFSKYNEDMYENQYNYKQSEPVIRDYEFAITPVYRTSELTMTVKYYSNDKVALQRSMDLIALNLFNSQGKYVHTLDIRYPLGRRLTTLLIEMFKIKAKVDIPEYKSKLKAEMGVLAEDVEVVAHFNDYLKQVAGRRIHCFANDTKRTGKRKGRGISVGVKEKSRYVTGMLMTNTDKAEIEEEDNRYFVELEYQLSFEHPYAFMVEQPIIVYNIFIPEPLRRLIRMDMPPDFDFSTSFYSNATAALPKPHRLQLGVTRSYTIPEIDTPGGVSCAGHYHRLFSRLVKVRYDKKSKKTYVEMDIRNIGFESDLEPFDLKEEIIDLILNSERDYVTKHDKSLFYFTLTEGQDQFTSKETLTLDKDGILRSKDYLDVKKTYRICMYIRMDFRTMDVKDKSRIMFYLKQQEKKLDGDGSVHKDNFTYLTQDGSLLYAPYSVRKRYLSTLNLLLLSYNLTDRELEHIKTLGYNRTDALFLLGGDISNIFPSVQIYHTEIIRRVDEEE